MQRAGLWSATLALAVLASACSRPAASAGRQRSEPAAPPYVAQFDTVWTRFNDVYPSFAYKHVDWTAQRAQFRPRAQRARSQNELVAVLLEMLRPLRDMHAYLVDPRGEAVPTFRPATQPNFDRVRWEIAMREANYIARPGSIGDGAIGGFSYVFVGSWKAPVSDDALDSLLERARYTPGLILDVRSNAGGSDAVALAFASRFTTRSMPASFVQIRTDPRVLDVEMPLKRTIAPRGLWQYTRPVVILAGRGGYSATESFVAVMRTLPNVTVIGDTTGGASGNPATYPLGNGWRFTVPRWLEFGPDRQPIEGRGVAPHVAMTWDPAAYDRERDPLIDAAVGLLGERSGMFRIMPLPNSAR